MACEHLLMDFKEIENHYICTCRQLRIANRYLKVNRTSENFHTWAYIDNTPICRTLEKKYEEGHFGRAVKELANGHNSSSNHEQRWKEYFTTLLKSITSGTEFYFFWMI